MLLSAKQTETCSASFTPHFSVETTVSLGFRRAFDSSLGSLSLRCADHIVAITPTEEAHLKRMTGSSKSISVLPNGVDFKEFENLSLGDEFKRKFLIRKDIVLFVGRITYSKGLTYLLRAIPAVVKQHPNVLFVFVGEDWGLKDLLVHEAEELGVSGSVLFTGPLLGNDFFGAFLAADVFVLPSIAGEAFGIVLLEAMAAGKPVVASNVGGVRDLVTDRVNGFLVPPGKTEALSETILALLNDNDLSHKMGIVNRVKAQKYSWKEIVDKLEILYNQLIA